MLIPYLLIRQLQRHSGCSEAESRNPAKAMLLLYFRRQANTIFMVSSGNHEKILFIL